MAETSAVQEPAAIRRAYEEAVVKRRFDDPRRRGVVMGVSTTDLTAGRGDLYVAVGLGRRLEAHGYEVVYLPPDDWYDLPPSTAVFVSMLAERTLRLEPLRLPVGVVPIAWARNNTDRWLADPQLGAYHAVLCSSEIAQAALARAFPGPTGVLRIGVDTELFTEQSSRSRSGVVTTVNQWGGERAVYSALGQLDLDDLDLSIYGTQRGLPASLESAARGPASFFDLAELYGAAQVVIDDQQDVNLGYGNVNSRLYESLACGALPVTNTRLGLDAVGLAEVPTYRTPAELERTLRHFADDEAERAARVGRLREVVVTHHSYEARAAQLHRFLEDHDLASDAAAVRTAGSRTVGHRVVAFLPDYRATNPFQDLLYGRTVSHGIAPVPIDPTTVGRLAGTFGARAILHVHWTATILGPATSWEDADARARSFLGAVDDLMAQGGQLVWTVHNVLPHECAYPDVETRLRQGLADRAAAVHVMCAETADLIGEHVTLPPERVRTIPHPSYLGVYGDVVDRTHARRELGLDGAGPVFLFLGQIRRYKGVDALLDAFDRVTGQLPGARLVVAGQPGREGAVQPTVERLRRHDGVVAQLAEVADADLQVFLAACDVVVLPYRAALNSGAMFLAWSFGRPVVAPDVGCLGPAVTPDTGVLFVPGEGDLSAALLEAARTLCTPQARQEARARAQELEPTAIAERFARLLDDLLPAERGGAEVRG